MTVMKESVYTQSSQLNEIDRTLSNSLDVFRMSQMSQNSECNEETPFQREVTYKSSTVEEGMQVDNADNAPKPVEISGAKTVLNCSESSTNVDGNLMKDGNTVVDAVVDVCRRHKIETLEPLDSISRASEGIHTSQTSAEETPSHPKLVGGRSLVEEVSSEITTQMPPVDC